MLCLHFSILQSAKVIVEKSPKRDEGARRSRCHGREVQAEGWPVQKCGRREGETAGRPVWLSWMCQVVDRVNV